MNRGVGEDFEDWVGARSASLARSAYLLTTDVQLAEDLLQDTLARVAQHWPELSRRGTPDAYARRVMHNLAIDRWRRRQVRPVEVAVEGRPELAVPGDDAEAVTRRVVLRDALARLTTKQRAVLSLRFYEDLTEVQKSVIDLIATEAPSGLNPSLRVDDRTYWERLADQVAAVGGSWSFIFAFTVVLLSWMALNLFLALFHAAFDPFPFIFLNLMLSMLAAVQAPIIMMSQNRQSQKDRMDAANDYQVNLKAEIEILALHEKLDDLRDRQLHDLIAKQQAQIDLLTRLVEDRRA